MSTLTASPKQKADFKKPKNLEAGEILYLVKHSGSYKTAPENKKLRSKAKIISRFSPFLILVFLLAVLLPYLFITGSGSIRNGWLLSMLFVFLTLNLLLADFALWNYFAGKKKAAIWGIEIVLSSTVIYLLT